MYGERDDPYAVLSRLGQRLETTLAPEAALETVAEAASEALKLPYTAIELGRDGEFRRVSEHGIQQGETVILPLVHQREEVGRMLVSPRAPGEKFSAEDERLLEDLARQAGAVAHDARLTVDLRRSRERLVTAREEERRRLRRDLHDGLGPTLGGLTLGLDAARSTLPPDTGATEELLADTESPDPRSRLRHKAPGARPEAACPGRPWPRPSHVPAGRQARPPLRRAPCEYRGDGPERWPDLLRGGTRAPAPLPAAVEVACYRIAQEAVTNVSRHARASSCRISLAVDEAWGVLVLEVTDDGVGLPEGRRAGVGMSSMRERAEELGGTLAVEAGPEGGTRVVARLPLPVKENQ